MAYPEDYVIQALRDVVRAWSLVPPAYKDLPLYSLEVKLSELVETVNEVYDPAPPLRFPGDAALS